MSSLVPSQLFSNGLDWSALRSQGWWQQDGGMDEQLRQHDSLSVSVFIHCVAPCGTLVYILKVDLDDLRGKIAMQSGGSAQSRDMFVWLCEYAPNP